MKKINSVGVFALIISTLIISDLGFRNAWADQGVDLLNTPEASVETKAPLFVVIGGFYGCQKLGSGEGPSPDHVTFLPQFMDAVYRPLESSLEVTPRLITACYGVVHEGGLDYQVDFEIQADQDKNKETLMIGSILHSFTYEDLAPIVEKVKDTVLDVLKSQPGTPVSIIGHSYGAWTAMQLSMKLAELQTPPKELITLDPISPFDCNPRAFLESGLEIVEGCTRFPADIGHEQRLEIKQALQGGWKNIYQTQFSRLHSGPIPELIEPTESLKFHVKGTHMIFNNYHDLLSRDPKVWNLIEGLTFQNLSRP